MTNVGMMIFHDEELKKVMTKADYENVKSEEDLDVLLVEGVEYENIDESEEFCEEQEYIYENIFRRVQEFCDVGVCFGEMEDVIAIFKTLEDKWFEFDQKMLKTGFKSKVYDFDAVYRKDEDEVYVTMKTNEKGFALETNVSGDIKMFESFDSVYEYLN